MTQQRTPGKRGRKPGTVLLNTPSIAQLALAQLDREAKEEVVLRQIKPEDRTTPNGFKQGSLVKLKADSFDEEPDLDFHTTYKVGRVLYPFQTGSGQYEVWLTTLQGVAMGYVNPDNLEPA